jgi:hypothetical protein
MLVITILEHMNEAAVVTTCYVHATNSSFNFLFSEIPMQFDLGIIEKKPHWEIHNFFLPTNY